MGLVEKAQEQARVGVIVRLDRLLVGVNLSEEERLEETPDVGKWVPIVKRRPQREGLQHVAVEVEIAAHVGSAMLPSSRLRTALTARPLWSVARKRGSPLPTARTLPSGISTENGMVLAPTRAIKALTALSATVTDICTPKLID